MGKFLPTLNMENDSLESLSAFLEEPIFLLEEDQKSIAAALQVSVGSEIPVDPQCQHKGNFSQAFRLMCKTIDIIELFEPEDIVPAYEKALNRIDGKSTILVEFADFLKTK